MVGRHLLVGIFFVSSFVCSLGAHAESSDVTPIAVALVPPLQLPDSGYSVRGIRLSALGLHREVRGIDIGLLGNVTDVAFKGIAISGLFNYNRGNASVIGLQLAAIGNFNSGPSTIYGVQIAAYNNAGTVYGLQLGLFNVANELHGIQIGLFNINRKGPFHGSPIINAAF